MRLLLPGVFALLLAPVLAVGQPADSTASISEACAGPEFRAFDFWIGQWVVRDSTGDRVGTSRISRVANGCGLLEEWSGTSGSRGTSLNYYDATDDTWHQEWVGSDGLVLHLSGDVTGEAMVLEGQRMGGEGPVWDRIRWRSLHDGRVRQEWLVSSDGGTTWERTFLGFYERATDSADC